MINSNQSDSNSIVNSTKEGPEYGEYKFRMYSNKVNDTIVPILEVDTNECSISVRISTYDQTRKVLDKQLALKVKNLWTINAVLTHFDEIWHIIEEYVNESTVKEEEQIQ